MLLHSDQGCRNKLTALAQPFGALFRFVIQPMISDMGLSCFYVSVLQEMFLLMRLA